MGQWVQLGKMGRKIFNLCFEGVGLWISGETANNPREVDRICTLWDCGGVEGLVQGGALSIGCQKRAGVRT